MQISNEIVSLKLYSQAWNAKVSGKLEEATTLFNDVIKGYPDSEVASYSRIQLESMRIPVKTDEISKKADAETIAIPAITDTAGKKTLSVISLILAVLAVLLVAMLGYRVWLAEKKLEYYQVLSTARTALYSDDKEMYDRNILRAHKLAGADNGAAFLEIEAALRKDDVKGALRVLKRCPVINDDVGLYLNRIKKHGAKNE
jgi:flagellar basal body-associated protein FliL